MGYNAICRQNEYFATAGEFGRTYLMLSIRDLFPRCWTGGMQ
jgi:hypothetical protein